jgi:ribonuclease HI
VANVPNLNASYFWTTMGRWSDVTASASSNKRELIACHKALESFSSILKKENCTDILILTDNTTAMYNINRRAASKQSQEISYICGFC